MENNFYNRDFEELVKNSADQYRMFPSEKVWKGIHNKLHTRRRWYGAGLAFLLLSIGTVTWVMLTNPSSNKNGSTNLIAQNNAADKKGVKKEKKEEVFIAPKLIQKPQSISKASSSLPAITTPVEIDEKQDAVSDNTYTAPIDESASIINIPISTITPSSITGNVVKEVLPVKTAAIVPGKVIKPEITFIAKAIPAKEKGTDAVIINEDNKNSTTVQDNDITVDLRLDKPAKAEPGSMMQDATKNAERTIASVQAPYTIESVINSYKRKATAKKSYWQIYFAPTVTYRSLKENETFIKAARAAASPINSNSPVPVTYTLADLDQVVKHKADIGFQLGTSFGYSLSKRLRFVTGFQFNVNKYDIKAYGHTTEVATISLNTLGRRSSVSTVTSYRVVGGGYNADWLRNFYFSASVPIGLEYIVAKTKKTYLGVGGNVQPTYVLDNKSYLVSTDYKNYAQVPSLTRHWNVNTAVEVFAGIINKKSEWRISPQVRYQTLSSYKNTYPVKENLFDFGVKLGLLLK